MLVIGIDPGTAITGYGVVRIHQGRDIEAVDYGVIETPAKAPMPERLVMLYEQLNQILTLHRPDTGAVEKLFFQKNVRTAISVGQARGVALLALAQAGISIGEYTPNEIKQAVAGYGAADKYQMQQMVRLLLNLEEIPKPDDAADALAVAICHLHSAQAQARYDSGIEQ
ncbi:MAG: crossover junction endodeoxyribonuclease RuvC [Anaerolineales bacterium]|nr:crossover junction endodeoxyribonuclease RuvC [Anaerolineales bacterium]